jgi:hypothetical protein
MSSLTQSTMSPPWKVYPQLDEASLGWIMGPGEYYRYEFRDWFAHMPAPEREAYESANAEPAGWRGFYERMKRRMH